MQEKLFSIGKAAELTGLTAETLRHYDRIGLIPPCNTDEWTGYRYYSEREIVCLNTVRSLRCMGLSLEEIKNILALEDFKELVSALEQATQKAEQKIAEMEEAKRRIERAKQFYKTKSNEQIEKGEFFVRNLPKRVILLSEHLREPTLDNLWDYHRHFYAQIGARNNPSFEFEDIAGVYRSMGEDRMFALCKRYLPDKNIVELPAGDYLCTRCNENMRARSLSALLKRAQKSDDSPSVCLVVLTGILHWEYELQIFLREDT